MDLHSLKQNAFEARKAHDDLNKERQQAAAHAYAARCAPLKELIERLAPLIQNESERLALQFSRFMRNDFPHLLEIEEKLHTREDFLREIPLPSICIDAYRECDPARKHEDTGSFIWTVGKKLWLQKFDRMKYYGRYEVYRACADELTSLHEPVFQVNQRMQVLYSSDPNRDNDLRLLHARAEWALAARQFLKWVAEDQLREIIVTDLKRKLDDLQRSMRARNPLN